MKKMTVFSLLEYFSWFCLHFHLVTRLCLLWLYIMAGLAESSIPKSQVALSSLHSFFISLHPSLLSRSQIRFGYYLSPRQDLNPSCAGDISLALSASLNIWALNLTWGKVETSVCVCLGSVSAKDIWESLRIAKLMHCLQPDSAKCLQLPINYISFLLKQKSDFHAA